MPTSSDLDALEALGWDTYVEHVPAPSEHAPRKNARRTGVGLRVSERASETAWVASWDTVTVKQ